MTEKLTYEAARTPEEIANWTERMMDWVWFHVDADTGDTDLEGYMEDCRKAGLNPTAAQAQSYLDYVAEPIRGELR